MSVLPRTAVSTWPSPRNLDSRRTRTLQRIVATAMLSIGFKPARSLARWFARELFELNPEAKRTAMRHIRTAFAEQLSERECQELCKAFFEQTADFATELLYAHRRLRPGSFHRHVAVPADFNQAPWSSSGQPAIFVTTYHGNLFVGALALAGAFGRLDVVLDDWAVQALRFWRRSPEDHPQLCFLPRSQAAARIPQLLDQGRKIMLVGEHVPAGERGHTVTFLNTTQRCYPTIALLSLMHQAPIVVFAAERTEKNFAFRLNIEEVLLPDDRRDVEPNLLTRQYMAALERIIRRRPEQYLWTRSWISQNS